jgi:hypothetical protein
MTGGENRRKSILKALRKRRIDREVHFPFYYRGTYKGEPMDWYKNLHQYSKNKIHCSCPMCSAKTRNKGNSKQKGMSPSINYKISDVRKIQKLEYEDD